MYSYMSLSATPIPPSRSSRSTELSSLCCPAASHQPSILHMAVHAALPIWPTLLSPTPPCSLVHSLCLRLCSCPANRFISGLPRWLSSKEAPCHAGAARDVGSIPGLGRSPGGGNGNSLQYSCLENSMDRGAWQATVHGVAKSQTQLRDWTTTIYTLIHYICFSLSGYFTLYDWW